MAENNSSSKVALKPRHVILLSMGAGAGISSWYTVVLDTTSILSGQIASFASGIISLF